MKRTASTIPGISACLAVAVGCRLVFPRLFGSLSDRSLALILDARQWADIGHWAQSSAPHFFLMQQTRLLLGDSLPAMRWLPVLAGLAVMLLLFLHALQTGCRRAGLIAVLLYAAVPLTLMESLNPSPAAGATVSILLGLILLDRAMSHNSLWRAVAAGLCWGLAWWCVPGAVFIILATGISLIDRRSPEPELRMVLTSLAGFALMFVPLTIFRHVTAVPTLSPGQPAANLLGSYVMYFVTVGSGLIVLPGLLWRTRQSFFDRSAWWMGLVALGLLVTGSPTLRETAAGIACALLVWFTAQWVEQKLSPQENASSFGRYFLPASLIAITLAGPALAFTALDASDRHGAARLEALRRLDIAEGVFGGGLEMLYLIDSPYNVAYFDALSPAEKKEGRRNGLANLLRDKKIAGVVLDRKRDDPRWQEQLDHDWMATRLLDNGEFIAYRLDDVFPSDRQQFITWKNLDPQWSRSTRIVTHSTPARLELVRQPRASEPYVPGIDRRVVVELTDEPGGEDRYAIDIDCFDSMDAKLWHHSLTIDLTERAPGPGVRLAPIVLERSKRSESEVIVVPPMIQEIATVRVTATSQSSPQTTLTVLARLPLWW